LRLRPSFDALIIAVFIFGGATAPSASAAPPDDACSLLTPAQVSAVLGVSVGAGSHQSPKYLKTCTWTQPNGPMIGSKNVALSLKTVEAFKNTQTQIEQAGALAKAEKSDAQPAVTPISGIGDDAYYSTDGAHASLSVKKGDVAFNVAVRGDFPSDQVKAMEKTLASQILSKL
jgi:hypothetical protein